MYIRFRMFNIVDLPGLILKHLLELIELLLDRPVPFSDHGDL
jgi:hypothetical protein